MLKRRCLRSLEVDIWVGFGDHFGLEWEGRMWWGVLFFLHNCFSPIPQAPRSGLHQQACLAGTPATPGPGWEEHLHTGIRNIAMKVSCWSRVCLEEHG